METVVITGKMEGKCLLERTLVGSNPYGTFGEIHNAVHVSTNRTTYVTSSIRKSSLDMGMTYHTLHSAHQHKI